MPPKAQHEEWNAIEEKGGVVRKEASKAVIKEDTAEAGIKEEKVKAAIAKRQN